MNAYLIQFIYLFASVLFILGIKYLTKPSSAVLGNRLSSLGMLIAVIATLLNSELMNYTLIFIALIIGSIIGFISAKKIQMTAVPQMVAVLNGLGGGASLFIALAYALYEFNELNFISQIAIEISLVIGAVTLLGSFIAFTKLQGICQNILKKIKVAHSINIILFLIIIALIIVNILFTFFFDNNFINILILISNLVIISLSLLLGLLLVLPIGGADMPVVIALLNSYSGLAAAGVGFINHNIILIISGTLVGASGLILTNIMCRAMNRSLLNVLLGLVGNEQGDTQTETDEIYQGKIKSSSPEEVAMILESANRVVIVPGYGLAMAQAQHAVKQLASLLEHHNIEVLYGIHPVAGRMPGHMNVLLAEAEVQYDKLLEMDDVNPLFKQTDVVIVIGANDVTNPLAKEDSSSPIYGMPILEVEEAKTVIVVKRSLSSGFAGLPNPLFTRDNTIMLFGDAKQMMIDTVNELKELYT